MFVQRSEFNSGYRIAFYKKYLLFITKMVKVKPLESTYDVLLDVLATISQVPLIGQHVSCFDMIFDLVVS